MKEVSFLEPARKEWPGSGSDWWGSVRCWPWLGRVAAFEGNGATGGGFDSTYQYEATYVNGACDVAVEVHKAQQWFITTHLIDWERVGYYSSRGTHVEYVNEIKMRADDSRDNFFVLPFEVADIEPTTNKRQAVCRLGGSRRWSVPDLVRPFEGRSAVPGGLDGGSRNRSAGLSCVYVVGRPHTTRVSPALRHLTAGGARRCIVQFKEAGYS